MHPSSIENMQWCYRRYAAPRILNDTSSVMTVLDVGGANVNGNYSDIFSGPNVRFLGMDLAAGPGVDIVLEDPYRFPLEAGSVDFVISGQMLEHCEFFWMAFAEMARVLKPDGFIFLIAPSAGPIHRYPVDCYRYYPDAYQALAKFTGCYLVDMRHDERGPWNDLVGVFAKTAQSPTLPHPAARPMPAPLFPSSAWLEQEVPLGQRSYLEVLAELHQALQPRAYLEIGVRNGRRLQLASCPALGVDLDPDLKVELPPCTEVLRMGSDDFFELETERLRSLGPDFVFIDGMHLFEYALRALMHVERLLGPDTIVVIDNIFPNHPVQVQRGRTTGVGPHDVRHLLQTLQNVRPDLVLCALDTAPTGLLVIAALNADNRVLWQRYNALVRKTQREPEPPPAAIQERYSALPPVGAPLEKLLDLLKSFRVSGQPIPKSRETLRRSARQLTVSPQA